MTNYKTIIVLEEIKGDVVGALITLGINSLSNEDKIKESDIMLCEIVEYINDQIKQIKNN